eukprot:gene17381-24012_t
MEINNNDEIVFHRSFQKLLVIRYNLSEKYLTLFDALSISSVDLDDIVGSSIPQMIHLRNLYHDIKNVLNEAYIEQQSIFHNIQTQIERFTNASLINHKIDNKEQSKTTQKLPNIDNFHEYVGIVHQLAQSNIFDQIGKDITDEVPSMISFNFQSLYNELVMIMNRKIEFFHIIRDIYDSYQNSINELAKSNNIRNFESRSHILIRPYRTYTLNDRFFITEVEKSLISNIVSFGIKCHFSFSNYDHVKYNNNSSISIDNDYKQLAENYLNNNYYQSISNNNSQNWEISFKCGVIFMLLFWSLSECWHNEQRNIIWNDPTFAIFMCIGDFILLLWMWGLSIHVWKSHGIDYIKLLQLDNTELGISDSCSCKSVVVKDPGK